MAVLNEAFLTYFFVVQDDLASGLLHIQIRVQPDERGRYGFDVKVMYTRELMALNECRHLLSCLIEISYMSFPLVMLVLIWTNTCTQKCS